MTSFSDIMRNPVALAGLAVMGGKPLGDALTESASTALEYEKQQRAIAEYDRQQQLQAQLPDIVAQYGNDPNQLFAQLVRAGVNPASAATVSANVSKTNNQGMLMQALGMGGESMAPNPAGGQADTFMRMGVATGNPSLIQYGSALLQQDNRLDERAYDSQVRAEEREYTDSVRLETRAAARAKEQEKRQYEETNKPLPGETTQKVALAKQGQRGIDDVRSLFFDEKGNLNRSLIAQVNSGVQLEGQAKKAYNALYRLTAAKLRLDTGAAATPKEIKENMAAYGPGLFDDSESASYKLDTLQPYFNDVLSLTGADRRVAPEPQPQMPSLPPAELPPEQLPGQGGLDDLLAQSQGLPTSQDLMQSAKQAPDGFFYVPDPQRPGKYLKVE